MQTIKEKREKQELQERKSYLPDRKEELNSPHDLSGLYLRIASDILSDKQFEQRNKNRKWKYGYDERYDLVVISKTGQIGEIYEISGLRIALPPVPNFADGIIKRSNYKGDQYWEREDLPAELAAIKNRARWDSRTTEFKKQWIGYINNQFDRRENGVFFMNNGTPTYITGSHYQYLQWSKTDVEYPDFREANRIFFIFWEACKADYRCFGMVYLKIRRSGFSYMAAAESVNIATISRKSKLGILSKTGPDAKSLFTGKVVPMNTGYPFFFKPQQDGMDRPKTELVYQSPASRITRYNKDDETLIDDDLGLETSIDWKNTDENSYDSEKLLHLIHDEAGKWLKPNTIDGSWNVVKTCLRIGSNIIGKCMMGSTCNAQNKGGSEFKKLYYASDVRKRNANGRTVSGLYKLFIPMEYNTEGFIDIYGMPVIASPTTPLRGPRGAVIKMGAIEFWKNEEAGLKHEPDKLNEFYRQNPRTEAHAFRDDSKESLFDLTRIYDEIDFNDGDVISSVTTGNFSWKDGVKDSQSVFTPDPRGRVKIAWIPPVHLQNRVIKKNGQLYPGNDHIGAFGADSYDISGTVGGGGSKGAIHGLTGFHMDDAPINFFFLEYVSRPPTVEVFFEDVLMAIHFYGMPILVENNKIRLLYFMKNRGYRPFSINRPDKPANKLSTTEKELGGIPSSSEDVLQAHAAGIETYINKHVGYDRMGTYRDPNDIGHMKFNKTLGDWAKFDIRNRTMYDATISSGYAIMAVQRHAFQPAKKQSEIKVTFARYNNTGLQSSIYE